MPPPDISAGRYYSNGAYGRAWGVRLVLALTPIQERGETLVRFKGMAGVCRRKSGECSLEEFRRWAKYEVQLNENSWQRVGPVNSGDPT